MRIRSILSILSIIAITLSCNSGGTSISGSVTGAEELTLVKISGRNTMDTLQVIPVSEGGDFSYIPEIDSLTFIFVYVNEQFNIPLLLNPDDQVELAITAVSPETNYTISGSYESEAIKSILEITEGAIKRVDSLSQMLDGSQDSGNFAALRGQLDVAYNQIMESSAQAFKDRIDQNPGDMANIYIFSQGVGNRPILSVQENFDYLEKVSNGIQETYPGHRITKSFKEDTDRMRAQVSEQSRLEEIKNAVSAGAVVPEISLPDPSGNVRNLSDLRGKVVLVDFWAAWCKPCRMENPNVVRMYKKYQPKGFEVYSVSLDGLPNQQNPKELWTQAVVQDGLMWDNHVSDLKGWNSQAVTTFGFQGIPYTVLVDRDGTIIETNLRGAALEQKLEELLGS